MEIELISIIRTLEHIKNIVVLKSDFEFHFLLMDVDVHLIKNIQVEEQLIYSRTRLNIGVDDNRSELSGNHYSINVSQGLFSKATNIGPLQTMMIIQYCMSLRSFHKSCKRDTD